MHFWHLPPQNLDTILGQPDVVHSFNFYCPTGLKQAHLIYTLHDLNFLEEPNWNTEVNRTICFEGVYKASLYADRILANSKYTRSHFLRTFPHYPAERVRVIYPASRFAQSEQNLNRPGELASMVQTGQFWLCVGTLEPRKNHLGLLRAYAAHKARYGKALPLVHAGGVGWLMDDFKEQISKLKLQDDVILLGYIDDQTLQCLYQHCFAFLYPSFFEGFGMPVLEAMSQGAAVIASNTTSIPEIVAGAGILVNPVNTQQIAQAMDELVEDPTRQAALRLAAPQQAARFSWQQAAQETLKSYQF